MVYNFYIKRNIQSASMQSWTVNIADFNIQGRKEMFYLTTLYLRLCGVGHMVKDHSDSEKGNPLMPHGLLFPISSKGSFTGTKSYRIAHTMAFVTQVVEHWLEREIAQWSTPWRIDPTTHCTMSECSYHGATSRSHFNNQW